MKILLAMVTFLFCQIVVYGGFHTCGYPHSWMVYVMENPIKTDDHWGTHICWTPPYLHPLVVTNTSLLKGSLSCRTEKDGDSPVRYVSIYMRIYSIYHAHMIIPTVACIYTYIYIYVQYIRHFSTYLSEFPQVKSPPFHGQNLETGGFGRWTVMEIWEKDACFFGGVLKQGYPQNGWFIREHTIYKWMRTGVPLD